MSKKKLGAGTEQANVLLVKPHHVGHERGELGGSVDMVVERRLCAVTRWEGGLGMHLAPVDVMIHNSHMAVTRRKTQRNHRQLPF